MKQSAKQFFDSYLWNMSEDTFCFLAKLLFVPLLAYVFLGVFVGEFNRDELEAVHTAWKMLHGELIFKDFFQHHHQLYYYLLMPLLSFFGEKVSTLYVMRIAMFGVFLLMLGAVFTIAQRYFNRSSAFVTVFFLMGLPMIPCGYQIRPDGAMVVCALLGLYFLFLFLEEQKYTFLFWSGISFALSFLFLQKIVLLFMLVAFFLCYLFIQGRISLANIGWYILYGSILPAIYFCYLLYNGMFQSYFVCNWLFNFYQPASAFMPHVRPLLQETKIILLFFLLGCIFYSKTRQQNYVCFFATGLLTTFFFIRVPWIQYFLLPMPFVAMIAAYGVITIFSKNYAQVFAVLLVHLSGATLGGGYLLLKAKRSAQLKKIQYVLDQTNQDDYVLDSSAYINVFRKDPHYFWFDGGMDMASEGFKKLYKQLFVQDFNVYKVIKEKKPKIIKTMYIEPDNEVIQNTYVTLTEYPKLLMRKKNG